LSHWGKKKIRVKKKANHFPKRGSGQKKEAPNFMARRSPAGKTTRQGQFVKSARVRGYPKTKSHQFNKNTGRGQGVCHHRRQEGISNKNKEGGGSKTRSRRYEGLKNVKERVHWLT